MRTDTTDILPSYDEALAKAAKFPSVANLHPVMIESIRYLAYDPQTAIAIAFARTIAARVSITLGQPESSVIFTEAKTKAYYHMMSHSTNRAVIFGFLSSLVLHTICTIIVLLTHGSTLLIERPISALLGFVVSGIGLSLFFNAIENRGVTEVLRTSGDNFYLHCNGGNFYNFLVRMVKKDRASAVNSVRVYDYIDDLANRIIRDLTNGIFTDATGTLPNRERSEKIRRCQELHYFDSAVIFVDEPPKM